MHKQIWVGMYVWGVVLSFIGGVIFFTLHDNFWGGGPMILGIALLAGAIARSIYCEVANKKMDREEGSQISTTCYKCQHEFTVGRNNVIPHRRFPEGYVRCPSCKTPLSYRTFVAVKEQET